MTDKKKPGAKNIQDLKAKLGLKKPGGAPGGDAPPPAVTPPPGIVPPPTDDIPAPPGGIVAPPGVQPPAGIKPPPAVTPPPGMMPPAATPAPPGGIVAPPGFEPPAQPAAAPGEPQFATTPSAEPIDLDIDSMQGKKSRRIVWIIVAAAACAMTMCGGYYIGDNGLRRDWVKKSKKACETTGALIKRLHRGTQAFQLAFEQELDKTKKGRVPLKYYNPNLFKRLTDEAEAFDTSNPKIKALMNKQIWTTHYRFVKNAGDLLPKLFNYLALLQQLKLAVTTGRAVENQYAKLLAKKTPEAKKPKPKKEPQFGVLIRGDRNALFAKLGKPCKGNKPISNYNEAEGFVLPNGKCYPFTKPAQGSACATYDGTVRVFSNTDEELVNRMKCTGQEDVVFKAWTYTVFQVQVLLKQVKAANAKDLYNRFFKSAR